MESHAGGPKAAGPSGPAHPYLDWAIETEFAYLRPGKWLPLLVEFDNKLSLREFTSLQWLEGSPLKNAVRIPELFRQVPMRILESDSFNFCVILIPRIPKTASDLIGDPKWKETIRSAELGPPVELIAPGAPSVAPSKQPVTEPSDAQRDTTAPRGWFDRLLAWLWSLVTSTPTPTPAPAPTASGQRVVTAVIDQGIAFAHPRFCHTTGTRIAHLWQQDLMSGGGIPDSAALTKAAIDAALKAAMTDTPGLELNAGAIDAGVLAARAQGGDEDLVYRAVGRLNFSVDGFKPLGRRRSHGTHVLDLAAGENPRSDGALRPIIAVDMPEEAVGDPAGSSLSIHAVWGLMYILMRAEAMRDAGEKLPVVVNLSYGPHDGPHDGSSLFEKFADALISLFDGNSDTPLRIVLGAGNFRQSRAHALFELQVDGVQTLHWRLQPGGLTPSFMEIWLPTANGAAVSVTLRSPRGEQVSVSPANQSAVFPLFGTQQIGAKYVPAGPWSPRSSVILSVVPTALDPSGASGQPVAASGLWTVTVTSLSNFPLNIDSWIKRTDTPGGRRAKGRQSYFDDPNYRRFVEVPTYPCDRPTGPMNFDPDNSSYVRRHGTLSGIATGAETFVIGGYCRKTKPWNPAIHDPLNPMPGRTLLRVRSHRAPREP